MRTNSVQSLAAFLLLIMASSLTYGLEPDSSAAGNPTAAASSSPEQVFRNRKLIHMGFWLVLSDEKDIHESVRGLRSLKAAIRSDIAVKRDSNFAVDQAERELTEMQLKYKDLNDQLAQIIDAGKGLSKQNVEVYNNWVNQYNATLARHDSLAVDINRKQKELEDLKKRDANSGDAHSRYVNLAMDLDPKVEAVAANYAALAQDSELQQSLATVNETAVPKVRLGPSGLFNDDLAFVRDCAKGISSSAVPVETHGGDPCVRATLNGKVTDLMVWDSGASLVTLSAETARSAGVTVTEENQPVTLEVADGRKVDARLAIVDSIRVGAFTVNHVECAVLPANYKGGGDLLGDTFQHHFTCRLDQNSGQLSLTPVDPSVTKSGAETSLPAASSPLDSGHAPAATPAVANRGTELIDKMVGSTSNKEDGAIVLSGTDRISTSAAFGTPVRFTIVAMTDSKNLEISYAADAIIFNAAENPEVLRITGGPADGRQGEDAGRIPANQYVTIVLTVTSKWMRISVDGEERYFTRANFASVKQALSIFPAEGSMVKVKSVIQSVPTR